MGTLRQKGPDVYLRVRVRPRASRNSVEVPSEGPVCVAVTAAPVGGAANEAVCDCLAKALGVPKRLVAVVSGGRSREKTLCVQGATAEELLRKLSPGPLARS